MEFQSSVTADSNHKNGFLVQSVSGSQQQRSWLCSDTCARFNFDKLLHWSARQLDFVMNALSEMRAIEHLPCNCIAFSSHLPRYQMDNVWNAEIAAQNNHCTTFAMQSKWQSRFHRDIFVKFAIASRASALILNFSECWIAPPAIEIHTICVILFKINVGAKMHQD